MDRTRELFEQAKELERQYKKHFNADLPSRRTGWWDPLHIVDYPEELEAGVKKMRKDIKHAIKTNTPFKEIPKEIWDQLVF